MSHRGVEVVLGRLATDSALRRRFRAGRQATLHELVALGIELSPIELEALAALSPHALQDFAGALDDRLQRAERGGGAGDEP